MPTKKQLYRRKLDEITKRFERMENDTVRQMRDLLLQLRKDIGGELATTEFEAFRLRELTANIERLVAQLDGQLKASVNGAITQAYNNGALAIVEPLQAAGVASGFFMPNTALLNTLLDFSADLITGVTAELIQKVTGQIRLATLGQTSVFDVMKEVTRILGVDAGKRQIVGGIAARAETIIRTETMRVFNLSNYSQMQATAQQVPDMQKQWVATGDSRTRDSHLRAHGQVVGVNEKFMVGSSEMDYPLDPTAPAKETIHCRCRMRVVHPDIEYPETALDKSVAAELERRKEKA